MDSEGDVLRIYILKSEVEDTDRPRWVTIIDVHQTALKSVDGLLQKLPCCLMFLALILVLFEVVNESREAEEPLYESDTWVWIEDLLAALFHMLPYVLHNLYPIELSQLPNLLFRYVRH